MSSLKQIAANRLNAEKSTGPNTVEGKAVVSMNALKHGLLSSQTVLPWESLSSLEELSQSLRAELQPKGAVEAVLVDRIVALVWRLRRAGKIETAILAIEQHEADLKRAWKETSSYVKRPPSPFASKPEEVKILDQQKYDEARAREAEIYSRRDEEEGAVLGRGFIKQAAHLATLHRYESTIERSLFKALHELQRIQAMRLGVSAALPIALDV